MENIELKKTAIKYIPKYTKEEAYNASLEYFGGDSLAATAFVNKYALRSPRIKDTPFVELTPRDMHERMARELALIELNFLTDTPNFYTSLNELERGEGRSFDSFMLIYDQLMKAFGNFKYIVPQGSPMSGIGNPFTKSSLSNCIVIDSPADSVPGIIDTGKEMASLYKVRAGVGTDISTLRPEHCFVNNPAQSTSGAWSFADFYSYVCRMIGQNGRRGALMVSMSISHPDIIQFVTCKEDLTKVTGANISVRLMDDFMEAVEKDSEWICKWPCETYESLNLIECNVDEVLEAGGEWIYTSINDIGTQVWSSKDPSETRFLRKLKARDLWDLINKTATSTAEPGLLFWDNYCNNLPSHNYPGFKSRGTNPCAEELLPANDSCRLTSINLKSFVINPYTKDAYFEWDKFEDMVKLGMRVQDNIVELEIRYLQEIIDLCDNEVEANLFNKLREMAIKGRRTGLGTHALADTLTALGIKYDTDEAIEFLDRLYCNFRDHAYTESINLAEERGAFPIYDYEVEKDNIFIKRLHPEIQARMKEVGRRNIALLTLAPTGTTSIVSRTSSGVEPVFMYFYTRRRKINPSDKDSEVHFTDQNGDMWQEFMVFHPTVEEFFAVNPGYKEKWEDIQRDMKPSEWSQALENILPDYFITSGNIDPHRRVVLQGTIQKYLDKGISSTINLPKGTTKETVADIYMQSWKHGLKGVTVYVDGSRSGVLVGATEKKNENDIVYSNAPKRPEYLPCLIHNPTIEGKKWTILVGLLNDKPYEVFAGLSEFVELPKKHKTGHIYKRKVSRGDNDVKSQYDLILGEEDDPIVVRDIATAFKDDNFSWATRMISTSLRHGTPVNFIVEQLSRDAGSNFQSFSKVMARTLKKFIVDGTKSGENCPECGTKMIFQEGCSSCLQCGYSKCS